MPAVDPWAPKQPGAGGSVAPLPSLPSFPSGGGRPAAVDPWAGGGSSNTALPPAPSVNPTAGKPSNGTGGGIGGFLGRAVHGLVNLPLALGQGIARFGQDVGTAAGRGTENIANDIAYAATLGHLGGYDTKHLGGAQGTPNYSHNGSALGSLIDTRPQALAEAIREYPSLEASRAGLAKSGNEIRHPTQFGKDFVADPTGTVLNTLANLALVAGPAAGLTRLGASVGDSARLAKAADVLDATGHVAGKAAAAPIIPFTKGAGVLGDLAAKTDLGQKFVEAGQNFAAAKGISAAKVEAGFDPLERARQQSKILKDVKGSADEFAAGLLRARGETASINGAPSLLEILTKPGNEAHLQEHLARIGTAEGINTPTEAAARLAVAPNENVANAESALRKVSAIGEEAKTAGVGLPPGKLGLDVYDKTAEPHPQTVADLTKKTSDQLAKAQKIADSRDLRALRLEAAQRTVEPNTGNSGILGVQDQAVKAARMGDKAMEASANASDAMNRIIGQGVNPEDIGRGPSTLDRLLGRQPAEAPVTPMELARQARENIQNAGTDAAGLTRNEQILARGDRAVARGEAASQELANRTGKTIETLTGRGKAAGLEEGTRAGQAREARLQADRAAKVVDKIKDRLDRETEAAKDNPKAAAAFLRTPIVESRNVLGGLKAELEGGHVTDPARVADLQQMVKDLDTYTHLRNYEGHESKVSYIPGANRAEAIADVRGQRGPGAPSGAKFRGMKQNAFREGVSTRFSKEGQIKMVQAEGMRAAHNETLKLVDQQASKAPSEILKDEVPNVSKLAPKEIDTAMRAKGFVSWDPSAGNPYAEVPIERVNADTRYLPRAVLNEMQRQTAKGGSLGFTAEAAKQAGGLVDKATTLLYRDPLSWMPHYNARRIIGDAMLANVNGDVPFRKMPGLLLQAAKAIHDGTYGDEFSNSLNDQNTKLGKFNRGVQIIPRTIDKMFKVSVELSKMKDGVPRPEAVRLASSVFGDIGQMSDAERNVFTRVVPAFPWMKSVAKAAEKLGHDHPATVLLALHLGDLAAKDPNAFKTSAAVDQLNPVGIFTAGPGIANPIVKALVGAATGINVNKGGKPISRESGEGQYGPVGLSHLAYYLTNQLPAGRLFHQSPAYGQDQRFATYDTGDLRKGPKSSPLLPAYTPPTENPKPIPGLPAIPGAWGPYWNTILGNPKAPVQSTQGLVAKAKNDLARQKAEKAYQEFVKAAHAAGVRH